MSIMSWSEFSLLLISLVLLSVHGDAARIPRTETCGYEACPVADPKKLNIHLVAHTHDDVGWLKTVDQYYFGSNSRTQKAGVQYILDSVIQALLANPERKFIYVETSFLWKWWLHQNDKVKEDVRNLINQGRLEIIGGGWSMNDEAVTHYHSLVDQYTWGFRRLNDTFGRCATPRIGWQIDPFGHSREQASLFAQLGFDGMFFGRLDYQDKNKRLKDKTMEFIWKGSPNLGARANLFTVALYNTYSPPPGFCYDILCNDEPIIDDPDSPDYNVKDRVEQLVRYAHRQATSYNTNNVIFTMGEDFNYQHAEMWFTNLDRLIRYVKEEKGSEVNIFYSTPSCYLKAVNDVKLQWSTKSDDFFPYASDPHSYWTGYFSSRPAIKFFERMGNNLLQVSKQLSVLTSLEGYEKQLEHFREAMGVMQHHDAVTGTEKQLVAYDYARILYDGMQQGTNIAADAIRKWRSNGNSNFASERMHTCMQLNISTCSYTEDKDFVLAIYNPLSQKVVSPIRVPVQNGKYNVIDLTDGKELTSQIVPIPNSIREIPGRKSTSTHELVFLASLPPLGYNTYTVKRSSENISPQVAIAKSIGNEFYNVSVDEYGHVVVEWKKQKDMELTQSFHYYDAMEGNNEEFRNRSSGAYIFRPKNASARNFMKPASYEVHTGPLVEEIHQCVTDWICQVVRVYNGMEYVEFDWLVGPIPVKDKVGKEVVTRYYSNLNSSGEFYTDSNGREMLKRKRNYRPTWNLELEEPVSGNYYPITSKISLKDDEKLLKLSLLTDRAEGGTSMRDGEIEMMIHRRLLRDDAFGVGEALNEFAFGEGLVVRGSHYIIGGSIQNLDELAVKEKTLARQLLLRPWPFIQSIEKNSSAPTPYAPNSQGTGLAKSLPQNVQILTLEPWTNGSVLLRLEHIFELGETARLSKPVEVNIQMISEDEAWAQTLITITPEDDATLREILDTATVSSTPDKHLVLDPDSIVYRRSFTHRQFVDSKKTEDEEPGEPEESEEVEQPEEPEEPEEVEQPEEPEEPKVQIEERSKEDAETQTYLQGIPVVHISIEYRDEASQTIYMSTPCPPLKYFKDIMTSMKEGPMPELKRSNVAATILSFHPETPHDVVMEQLSMDVTDEERKVFESKVSAEEETEVEITEILNFLLARAFWIDDPTSQAQAETSDKATQTYIKYNNRTKIFVIDSQVQTGLSCEPKQSNTMLLTDYWETKKMISSYLDDCISKGIDVRIVIDDIIDEIVDKCAGRIRYPMKEQIIQTIATYKLDDEKEEDVLRKLKLDMVVDPLEASIIVIPLMDNLLEMTCNVVSENAIHTVKIILKGILQRTMVIIVKLMELQKQAQRKSIDQVLATRKKKILESMTKKETETISTQTSIAAISEVKKIKRSKEVLCSVCRRQSMCQWCLNNQEVESVPKEEIKILRTQDILLAYKPCYIVTKMTEKEENLQPPCPLETKLKPPLQLPPIGSYGGSCRTICAFLQGDKEIGPQESVNEWSYVTDATIMKACSIKESVSSSSQTIVTLLDQPICPPFSSNHSTLTSQAANALQILKNTFCTQENCITSSQQTLKNYSFTKNEDACTKSTCNACLSINNISDKMNGQKISCTQQTYKTFSKLHLPNTNTYINHTSSRIPIKSHGDGLKIIPIYLSQDTRT